MVERFEKLGVNLEWSYCIPKDEYYCAATIPVFNSKTQTTSAPEVVEKTTVENLIDEFR